MEVKEAEFLLFLNPYTFVVYLSFVKNKTLFKIRKYLNFLILQAWHAWALMNYEAVLFYKQMNQTEEGTPQTPAEIGATSKLELSPRPESVSI